MQIIMNASTSFQHADYLSQHLATCNDNYESSNTFFPSFVEAHHEQFAKYQEQETNSALINLEITTNPKKNTLLDSPKNFRINKAFAIKEIFQ